MVPARPFFLSALVATAVLLFPEHAAATRIEPLGPAEPSAPTPAPPVANPESKSSPSEVVVEAPEPRFVAPTRRDKIGRIWAPVLIDGKGPYRLVLDTGHRRAVAARQELRKLLSTVSPT